VEEINTTALEDLKNNYVASHDEGTSEDENESSASEEDEDESSSEYNSKDELEF
jgi:hypothetical protein